MDVIENYIRQIPPITRTWAIGSLALSLSVQCKVFAPLNLYFSYGSAISNNQVSSRCRHYKSAYNNQYSPGE